MPAIRMRVTRIKKATYPHEHTEVGGLGWSQTEDSAIDYIERGIYQYYVTLEGLAVELQIAMNGTRKYLTTRLGHGLPEGRLLSIPGA
jgi:hypothetical protein